MAGFHINLRLVVTAAQRINLAVQRRRTQVATRVGQIRFALPVLSSVERQTPVITSLRVTIGFVAAKVM